MKYIYISIFFILNLFISNNVIADQSVIKELQKGGKIVFIRHSLAPGNGDPNNIDLNRCDTQRNLNQQGIEQSKKIGKLFRSMLSGSPFPGASECLINTIFPPFCNSLITD